MEILALALVVVGFGASLVVILYLLVDTTNKIGLVKMPGAVTRVVVEALELVPGDVLVDLGAGDGRVLKAALAREPEIRAVGYENNPVMWPPKGVEWHRTDLFKADLRTATKVVCYLNSELNGRLAPKFETELRPGAVVVTVQFELPGREPVRAIEPKDAPKYAAKVFIYKF